MLILETFLIVLDSSEYVKINVLCCAVLAGLCLDLKSKLASLDASISNCITLILVLKGRQDFQICLIKIQRNLVHYFSYEYMKKCLLKGSKIQYSVQLLCFYVL